MTEHPTPENNRPADPTPHDSGERIGLHGPGEILAAIPYLLGYHPADGDVVIMALQGPEQRVVMSIVYHLSAPTALNRLWEDFSTHPNRPDIDTAWLIAYLPAGAESELRDLSASAHPLLSEVLRVHAGRWWCLTCPHPDTYCPPQGRALPALSHDMAAIFALDGASSGGTYADLAEILRPGPPAAVAQVSAYLNVVQQRRRSDPDAGAAPENSYDLLKAAHTRFAAGAQDLSARQAGQLLGALADTQVRHRCLPWHDDAAWWLWSALIACAPPAHVPTVAALLAASAYQRGDGASARIAAEHALSYDPAHTLAALVWEAVHLRIHPSDFTEQITRALAQLYPDD